MLESKSSAPPSALSWSQGLALQQHQILVLNETSTVQSSSLGAPKNRMSKEQSVLIWSHSWFLCEQRIRGLSREFLRSLAPELSCDSILW